MENILNGIVLQQKVKKKLQNNRLELAKSFFFKCFVRLLLSFLLKDHTNDWLFAKLSFKFCEHVSNAPNMV